MVRLLGVAAAAGALILIAALALLQQHRSSQPASLRAAEAEFSRLRARFADQQPLLDMDERRALPDAGAPGAAARLRSFHTVIFDTRGGERLVRISVPYWFGRRFAGRDRAFQWLGELTFLDDTEFDAERIQLSLSQVERHGPGLLADYRHSSGGQFIAWVE